MATASPPSAPARRAACRVAGLVAALMLTMAAVGCSGRDDTSATPKPTTQPPPVTIGMSAGGGVRVIVGALPVSAVRYAVPRGAFMVSPDGSDTGDGSAAAPWRTVAHAVQRSPSGSVIVLRAGTYRESVEINDKRLTLQAYPGEEVWFDGSEPMGEFVADRPGVWRLDGWTTSFERTPADSHYVADERPLAGWPEQVYFDGAAMTQVASVDELTPGTFVADPAGQRLYLGSDPAGHAVTASVREWALYLHGKGSRGSRLLGIGVRRYATPVGSLAAVRVHVDDAVVENVVTEDNAYAGISVMGRRVSVRQVTARRNGQLGVQARHADGLYLGRTLLEGNNTEGFDPSQQAGGAKLTSSRGLRLEQNLVRDNAGPGLWLDQSVLGSAIVANRAVRNSRSGFMVELSAQVLVAGNLGADNGINGLYVLESNDVRVVANTFVQNGGRDVWILEGGRSSSDKGSPDHDRRFPVPDERLSFDVQRVTIANNVIADDAAGTARSSALIGVEDVTGRRSAAAMEVSSDHNAFWRRRPASTVAFSTWAAYPDPVEVSSSISGHRRATGQDRASRSREGGADPFLTGSGEDTRPAGSGWSRHGGGLLPADVRAELDLANGSRDVGVPATVQLLIGSPR